MAQLFSLGRVATYHMIAAFLKNADGDFDYPALLLSVVVLIPAISLLFWIIPKSIRKRRVWVGSANMYYPGKGHVVERDKNPVQFWFFIAFYIFGDFVFFVIAEGSSMGIMRAHH